jgi:hypothetical protein
VKSSKMAVVFGECGRECLSGPGNTDHRPCSLSSDAEEIFLEILHEIRDVRVIKKYLKK